MARKSRPICVIDAETDPFKRRRVPKPFIWGFYDGENYLEFTETEKLVEHLRDLNCICYAHNGGRFDWHFLLPYIEPYEEIMLINGRIAKMHIGECECRDSINIIPVRLADYKKDDIDYALMEEYERDKPENKRKISAYLKSDCVYLHELITAFVGEYGLQLTQAGAAMKQWVKISGASAPKTTPEFYLEMSQYYYGGRVQCFESGIIDDRFSVYDINSAYPFAMLHAHPYSDNYDRSDGFVKNADFYTVRCISQGAFPFRFPGAGLAFPDDDIIRTYFITRWEYEAAIETGSISDVSVLESVSFMGHTDFADYVNYFYEKRNACKAVDDDAGSLFCKLLMNSLYGKFAANPSNYKNYMIVPENMAAGLDHVEGWNHCGSLGPWALAESPLDEERQRFYNVATGASITGFVRAMLWRAICGSGGILYCDTDSVVVRKMGDAIKLGGKLGEWKHEGEFDRAGIAGKKLYIMRGAPGWWNVTDEKGTGHKTVFSDTKPKNAERLYKTASKGAKLTKSQLWSVARGESVTYESEAPTFSPKKKPTFVKRKIKFTAK